MDLRSTHVVAVGGFVCSQYDDQEALGDGVIHGQEGIAAGGSGKIWALGGYTGNAATATGYVWVQIDGVLRKLLAA